MLRMVQSGFAGFDHQVLSSSAIWVCVECDICLHTCPNQVNLPRTMRFFRAEALRLGLSHAPGIGTSFHEGGQPNEILIRSGH
jgi:heterodisulfide reductase subunit C